MFTVLLERAEGLVQSGTWPNQVTLGFHFVPGGGDVKYSKMRLSRRDWILITSQVGSLGVHL